jgi:chromosome segregation ATPase
MLGLEDGEVGDAGEVEVVGADKVAYVELSKEYRIISIEAATSPEYSFYQAYLVDREQHGLDVQAFIRDLEAYNQRVNAYNQTIEAYNQALDAYEQEVEEYNSALGGRTTLPEPEYSQFKEWAEELEESFTILMDTKADIRKEQLVLVSMLHELNEQQLEIETASGGMGDVNWLPLGVVASIEVYY